MIFNLYGAFYFRFFPLTVETLPYGRGLLAAPGPARPAVLPALFPAQARDRGTFFGRQGECPRLASQRTEFLCGLILLCLQCLYLSSYFQEQGPHRRGC